MKQSILLAVLLTLVLAAAASSGQMSVNYPAVYPAGDGSMYQIYLGIDGDMALDGVVDYGVGTGPRGVYGPPSAGETDAVVDYGVGNGPRGVYGPPAENEMDGVVDYGVGSGPRSALGGTN